MHNIFCFISNTFLSSAKDLIFKALILINVYTSEVCKQNFLAVVKANRHKILKADFNLFRVTICKYSALLFSPLLLYYYK